MFFWSKLASVYNHCLGFVSLLIKRAPPQCGFFKRASKDQYDAAYHKAQIHVQPSDKDKLSAEA